MHEYREVLMVDATGKVQFPDMGRPLWESWHLMEASGMWRQFQSGACTIACLPVDGMRGGLLGMLKMTLGKAKLFSFATIAVCLLLASNAGFAAEKKCSHEIVVAAAADLSSALKEVGDNYEKKTGCSVKLAFGASGSLTQQIQNGAPFDVFFSADMDYPKQLVAAHEADGATLYQYAVGKLVLWVPADSPLDVEAKGMSILTDPSVEKIAIANPEHAPYGKAAVAALKHVQMYDLVSNRLVLGENISQAAQFVESGNAQAGFVAMAHAVSPGMKGKGKYWEIPAEAYPALAQGLVVLSHSKRKKDAAAFVEYVKSPEAAGVFTKYGFTLPMPAMAKAPVTAK